MHRQYRILPSITTRAHKVARRQRVLKAIGDLCGPVRPEQVRLSHELESLDDRLRTQWKP